jgi:NAD(P)-dependent dehydrogenase (short-subunit alcohol dehydrogenase family)
MSNAYDSRGTGGVSMTTRWWVVTGGAHGIGATISRAAAEAGYGVGIWDTDLAAAGALAADLGPTAVPIQVDVTDEAAVEAAFDAMPDRPDAVVNNAGIVRFGPLLDLAVADWEQVLRVNLTGTFLVSRAFARRSSPALGGSIVNIASINGLAAAPNGGGYSASKAAVVMLTQQMALEWSGLGLRVNVVAPGLIDAGMSEPIYADAEVRDLRRGKVPMNRLGSAEEVAAAVLFLAGADAAYITGQTIAVDGGISVAALGSLSRPRSVDRVGV